MSNTMKWAIFLVVVMFAFVGMIAVFAKDGSSVDMERYTICINAGGEYDHTDWSCDLPGVD